jgi:hypothetical protein
MCHDCKFEARYLASVGEKDASLPPYEVVITDGGFGALARYVVVSSTACTNAPPTVRKVTGVSVARPTVYSTSRSASVLKRQVVRTACHAR